MMTSSVSEMVTPRQLISIIFFLAAYTIVFLTAVIISDLFFTYYELFHHLSDEVSMKLGTTHDVKMRIFSAAFSLMAMMVELDNPFVEENVPILKFFIPRSIFLFLVATLSETNPMLEYERRIANNNNNNRMNYADDMDDIFSSYNSGGYNYNYTSSGGYDDRYLTSYYNETEVSNNNESTEVFIQDEIPDVILSLPLVSATFLKISVWFYFLFGILCFDRFKPNAFVPSEDQASNSGSNNNNSKRILV